MQTPLTTLQRDQLAAHLAALDQQLQKISYHFNTTIEDCSINIAGINSNRDFTKQLLTWSKIIPVPVARLKQFLEQYNGDLLVQRNTLVNILEAGTMDFAANTVFLSCDRCVRPTIHRNYFIVPGNEAIGVPTPAGWFICNECDHLQHYKNSFFTDPKNLHS